MAWHENHWRQNRNTGVISKGLTWIRNIGAGFTEMAMDGKK
jgi:hypothetical protein